jgi:hypothetical protein
LKVTYKDTLAGKLQSRRTEFSYLVLQSTSPETSTSPKNQLAPTIPNEHGSIHENRRTTSMESRFEHQKLPAGPAHLHRISETPSQILAGSETKTHAVQTESDGTNAIGAREHRIVWIQPHELELNPNILRGDEPPSREKKGSDRAR